jgi:hypothetical protein
MPKHETGMLDTAIKLHVCTRSQNRSSAELHVLTTLKMVGYVGSMISPQIMAGRNYFSPARNQICLQSLISLNYTGLRKK